MTLNMMGQIKHQLKNGYHLLKRKINCERFN
jgi:hypothetical protein